MTPQLVQLLFGILFVTAGAAVLKAPLPESYVWLPGEVRFFRWFTALPTIALGLLIGWPR